jgi:hypothetical protein
MQCHMRGEVASIGRACEPYSGVFDPRLAALRANVLVTPAIA